MPPEVAFISITCADGSLHIMQFVVVQWRENGQPEWIRTPTPESIQTEINKTFFPAPPVSWRIVKLQDIPQDRTFRDAWKDTGVIEVDMPKARIIHLEKIRRARDEKLAELDKDWMRATGQKKIKDADNIEAVRQQLRDLPQTINLESVQTPEDLKNLWPDILK